MIWRYLTIESIIKTGGLLLMKNTKMSDETKATIIILLWELFFYLACLFNSVTWWLIFGIITATEVISVCFDTIIEKTTKENKKNRNLL